MFAWQNALEGSLQLPGLRLEASGRRPYRRGQVRSDALPAGSRRPIAGGLEYATSLFEPATIERYLGYFRTLLEAMVADDTRAVDRLPCSGTQSAISVLYEWNDTKTEYPGQVRA